MRPLYQLSHNNCTCFLVFFRLNADEGVVMWQADDDDDNDDDDVDNDDTDANADVRVLGRWQQREKRTKLLQRFFLDKTGPTCSKISSMIFLLTWLEKKPSAKNKKQVKQNKIFCGGGKSWSIQLKGNKMSETTTSLVSKRRQDKCLINFFLHSRRLVVAVVVVIVVVVIDVVFSFEGVKIKLVGKTLSKKKVTFWTRWLEFEIPFDDVTSSSFLKQFLGIICCRLACRVRIRTPNLQIQSLNSVWFWSTMLLALKSMQV